MANDVGWAFIHAGVSQLPGGEDGSVQINDNDASFNGDSKLKYDLYSNTLSLQGDLDVAGNINANAINIDVTNKNITNLDAFGSTNFGDSLDDTHNFQGEVTIDGNLNATAFYGDGTNLSGLITSYTNPADNRLITSIDGSSVNSEENLTFDGSRLTVLGDAEIAVGISTPLGTITELTSSNARLLNELVVGESLSTIIGDTISTTNVNATSLSGQITTSAQPLITSVGNLDSLTVDSTTLVVKDTTHRVGIGRGGPMRSLDVLHASEPQVRLSNTNEIYVDLQATTDGHLHIAPSAGRVGINTDSPTEALDINGNARITGDLLVEGTLSARVTDFVVSADTTTLGDSGTDSVIINAGIVTAPNGLNFDEGTFVIDTTNNRVGIGVDTPSTSLEITSATDAQLKLSNGAENTILTTLTNGDFNIAPTGPSAKVDSELKVTGDTTLGTDTTNKTDVNGDLTITGLTYGPEGEFDILRGTSISDNTLTITGGDITGAGNISASTISGTLTTAHQENITRVGNLENLTVDSDTLVVKATTHRVGIGRGGPTRKLDVMDTVDPQMRLSNSGTMYTDFETNAEGNLIISPSGTQVTCDGDLHVDGTVYANELKVKITEVERTHLSSSGSTVLGDTDDDTHTLMGTTIHNGAVVYNRKVVTTSGDMDATDYLICINASSDVDIRLPLASTLRSGQVFIIKDEGGTSDANVIRITTHSGDTIQGLDDVRLRFPGSFISVYTDGVDTFHGL